MDKELKNRLQDFYIKDKNQCLGLKDWLEIQHKSFKLYDALVCIYEYAGGKPLLMQDIIRHFIDQKKRNSSSKGGDEVKHHIDIVPNADGKLELQGYYPNQETKKRGQHRAVDNPKIIKRDGTVSKSYQSSEEKMWALGVLVRDLYPNEDNSFLTHAMQAIKKYANNVLKKSPEKVVSLIRKKKLYYDPSDEQIKPRLNTESKEHRIIIITEEAAKKLNEEIEMTEYKFNTCIKTFLHDILVDPVNAQPSEILKLNGLNRHKLIVLLRNNNLLVKDERIVDKDENGNDRTATMQVRYKVPKKNFDRKLRNLYIKTFERNVPVNNSFDEENITEDGGAMGGATSADSSGQFSQPVFPMQRRETIYNKDIDEDTTTSSVGNYQYDVPFIGDKATLSRKNGVGGSTSINNV